MNIVLFITGLLFGVILIYCLMKRKNEEFKREKIALNEENIVLKERINTLSDESRIKNVVENISMKALHDNNEEFLRLADRVFKDQQIQSNSQLEKKEIELKSTIEPMKILLNEVKNKMGNIEKDYSITFAEAKEQLKYLKEDQKNLLKETNNLTNALKLPHVRGRWGEIQLRKVVEISGMINHVDFIEQLSSNSFEGTKIRPDLVVNLPGDKIIIIDAKTPLDAYLNGIETEIDEEKKLFFKKHCDQVKEHIKKLGSKNYWDSFANSPEFVVLFLPNDSFYQVALENDHTLLEWAFKRNVLLATPTTLIALLKSAAYGWNQATLTENAREIWEIGKDLYDRTANFSNHFEEIRKGLEKTIESYNNSVGSLESRVLPGARKFRDLGISSEKNILNLEVIDKKPKEIRKNKEKNSEIDPGEDK